MRRYGHGNGLPAGTYHGAFGAFPRTSVARTGASLRAVAQLHALRGAGIHGLSGGLGANVCEDTGWKTAQNLLATGGALLSTSDSETALTAGEIVDATASTWEAECARRTAEQATTGATGSEAIDAMIADEEARTASAVTSAEATVLPIMRLSSSTYQAAYKVATGATGATSGGTAPAPSSGVSPIVYVAGAAAVGTLAWFLLRKR